jgi:hypothetical protein
VDFDVTDQLLIIFLHSSDSGQVVGGSTMRQYISFSVYRESLCFNEARILCNIPVEFEILMKLVGLVKMCLNETQ